MPVLTGIMDGSAGMLFAGAEHGKLFNVTGSTDVLALCTTKPAPQDRLLTRALGIDGKFLAVSTLAAVASAIYWARDQFFSEWPIEQFRKEFHRLAKAGPKASGGVTFDPYMAGERTSIEQKTGGISRDHPRLHADPPPLGNRRRTHQGQRLTPSPPRRYGNPAPPGCGGVRGRRPAG